MYYPIPSYPHVLNIHFHAVFFIALTDALCSTTPIDINSDENLIFKSPNYDSGNYPSSMFCQWQFTAPADAVILTQFNTIDVTFLSDIIYYGETTGVGDLARISLYSGSYDSPPASRVSSGNIVTISFDTAESREDDIGRGFQVTLTAVTKRGKLYTKHIHYTQVKYKIVYT